MHSDLFSLRTRKGLDLAREAAREHALFAGLIIAYAVALAATAVAHGVAGLISYDIYSAMLGGLIAVFLQVAILGRPVYIMLFIRPARLIQHVLRDFRTNLFAAERVVIAVPVLVLLPVFLSAFTCFKSMIPVIQPYTWDTTLAAWDQALHGGVQPWELLQPLLGHPLITAVINVAYNMWFFVMYALWFWQTFSLKDRQLRMQFFLAYMLNWILLGTVLALVFSSGGPCFYGRITGAEDIYAPLIDYLRSANDVVPVWAVGTQDLIWNDFKAGGFGLGSGISAMPSMHVAQAVLFALLGWRSGRKLGIALTVYAAVIMLGSVHLGWHYALDGYVSIAGALLIWRLAGWLVARPLSLPRLAPLQAQPAV